MSDSSGNSIEQELKEQRELLEKIYKQNKKILRHLLWATIGSLVRILLIVVPLVIALIYLPPLIMGYVGQMQSVLGQVQGTKQQIGNTLNGGTQSIDQLMEQLKQFGR